MKWYGITRDGNFKFLGVYDTWDECEEENGEDCWWLIDYITAREWAITVLENSD